MIIDLVKLGNSSRDFEYEAAPAAIDLGADSGAKLAGPALVKGRISPHAARTAVEGSIAVDIELECSRCLGVVERRFEIPFSDSFVTKEFYSESKETELSANDLDVAVFEGDTVDVDEIVREQILLSLPEQVFCKEDCEGLCQRCGANLNLKDCGCADDEIDPRWAGLKNLK